MTVWPEKHVVTCFLECQGRILLLRRSSKVGSFQGMWAGVSGYVEDTPGRQSLTEIREETGLGPEDVTLIMEGCPLAVDDEETSTRWIIHPYLYHIPSTCVITIDWEHDEYRWVEPQEIADYDIVPKLQEAYLSVCGTA